GNAAPGNGLRRDRASFTRGTLVQGLRRGARVPCRRRVARLGPLDPGGRSGAFVNEDLSERLVDGINATYGSHAGHRAVHAKGVLCAGTFRPTDSASALSRARHFAGAPVRTHVRFSNGGGDPTVPDGTRDARGMAVKFYLPDGKTTDVVALSLPVFFTR